MDPSSRRPAAGRMTQTIDAALEQFRGAFDQLPPNHSAKKIGGHKAYDLARRAEPVALKTGRRSPFARSIAPAGTAIWSRLVRERERRVLRARARPRPRAGARMRRASAMPCGAQRSGRFDVARRCRSTTAERLGPGVAAHILSPADALGDFPSVTVTPTASVGCFTVTRSIQTT